MMKKSLSLLLALLLCLSLLSLGAMASGEADAEDVEAAESVDEAEAPAEEPAEAPAEEPVEEPAADGVSGIPVTLDYFPDEVFRGYVWENIDNGDGVLTDSERAAVEYIDVYQLEIYSLEGIGYFPNLLYLECGDCFLESLDLTGNPALEEAYCSFNYLEEIDVTNCPELWYLDVYDNYLTSLDLSGCPRLEGLDCSMNMLSSLDLRHNPELNFLSCYANELTDLDLSRCPKLGDLDCSFNQITSLDLSGCPLLTAAVKNGLRQPLIDDGADWYYIDGGEDSPYYIMINDTVYYAESCLVTDGGVELTTGAAPTPIPEAKPYLLISDDGKTAHAINYDGLYARVALVLDNSGVSGLYVTQVTINPDGTIVIPQFTVPGLTVTGVNVSLVVTLADITSSTPHTMAMDFKMF